MTHSVDAVVFLPSGQRLLAAHRSSICIIDSMSGAKLHEAAFFDTSLKILAMSWPVVLHRQHVMAKLHETAFFDSSLCPGLRKTKMISKIDATKRNAHPIP
jgi:hypothetical protein